MKTKLILLCLVPTILLAQEPAAEPKPVSDLTTQAIESSHVLIRLPSPDRLDAIGKTLHPFIKGLLPNAEIAGVLEKGSASSLLLAEIGLGGKEISRDKPIFVSPLDHGAYVMASTADGFVTTGPAGTVEAKKRGKPTSMLAGDVSIHVYADRLLTQLKPWIEQGMNMAAGMAGMVPMVPEPVKKLLPSAMNIGKEALFSIASFDYALTLKGDKAYSEGRVITKEGSALRKQLAAAGAPVDNVLAGYLPKGALLYSDGGGFDAMGAAFGDLLDKHLGEGASLAFGHMMGPDVTSWGVTSGRSAMSLTMQGMMGGSKLEIHELKEGVDPKTVTDKFDTKAINAALTKHGIGMAYSLKKDVATDGETKIHQIEIEATDPILGMMTGMMEVYVAAEGRYLVVVSSMSAEADMKALLAKLRGEPDMEHPHIKAMSKLGRKRHAGVTINLGSMKPIGQMLGMFLPQAAAMFGALPDDLSLSTAFTVADGNIHWRGDWPVKEMAALATGLKGMMGGMGGGGDAPPPPDEDFDDDDDGR